MKDLLFTFVTPEKELLKEQAVEEILCPSEKGEINILPGHAPLITRLRPGILSYKKGGGWERSSVSWGYLEVYPSGVRVLAETAEAGHEISKVKAEKRLKELQEKLKNPRLSPKEIRHLQDEMQKERARLALEISPKGAGR